MSESLYVPMYQLPENMQDGTVSMLEGDIKGTYPFYHKISVGSVLQFGLYPERQRVLFILSGKCVFIQDGQTFSAKERASVIPDPDIAFTIKAEETTSVFEITWDLTQADKKELQNCRPEYPIIQLYSKCPQYTENFKSDRTISRTIVRHNILPRFSMGSNEAEENDRVELNNHPAIDQYFFSFPENDVNLLIEDKKIHFTGNTLVHIPLGCYHGVEIGKRQKMHYIWIDFIVDEEAGIQYLNTVHQPLKNKED